MIFNGHFVLEPAFSLSFGKLFIILIEMFPEIVACLFMYRNKRPVKRKTNRTRRL